MKFKYISLLVVFTLVFSLFLRWVEDGEGDVSGNTPHWLPFGSLGLQIWERSVNASDLN